ncbi:MAG: DUF4276 family protein [Rhodobacteraceae bacterium]|nr:DUF4276 family protein [Paracoccaceae bacterium]
MIRLAVSVEGQTEEEFVKNILYPHLQRYDIWSIPVLLGRARGSNQGGGNVSIDRLFEDIKNLLYKFDFVTSLVDFYGFRDKGELDVDELEARIHKRILEIYPNRGNVFIPYVQLHEFEGLLFSDVNQLIDLFETSPRNTNELRRIAQEFPNPEDINDNSNTAPSKRIIRIEPEYNKVIDGPLIAEMIGLNIIRAKCPRFDCWVTKLESLQDCSQY